MPNRIRAGENGSDTPHRFPRLLDPFLNGDVKILQVPQYGSDHGGLSVRVPPAIRPLSGSVFGKLSPG